MEQPSNRELIDSYFEDREQTRADHTVLGLLPQLKKRIEPFARGGVEQEDVFVVAWRNLRRYARRGLHADEEELLEVIVQMVEMEVESLPIGYSQSERGIHNVADKLQNAYVTIASEGVEPTPEACADWLRLSVYDYYRECSEVCAVALMYEVSDPRPREDESDELRQLRLAVWATSQHPSRLHITLKEDVDVESLIGLLSSLNSIHKILSGTSLSVPVVEVGRPDAMAAPTTVLEPEPA